MRKSRSVVVVGEHVSIVDSGCVYISINYHHGMYLCLSVDPNVNAHKGQRQRSSSSYPSISSAMYFTSCIDDATCDGRCWGVIADSLIRMEFKFNVLWRLFSGRRDSDSQTVTGVGKCSFC